MRVKTFNLTSLKVEVGTGFRSELEFVEMVGVWVWVRVVALVEMAGIGAG